MISIPHEPVPDRFSIRISGLLERAQVKVLQPLNVWIIFKLVIYVYAYYEIFRHRLVTVTRMDWYFIYFPFFISIFVLFPEMYIKSSYIRSTKRIQFFRDVSVCIFSVSLFS